jgi:hypothetical protein
MGRTLPSVTQVFLREQESFVRFRRALRRSDQRALDDLFAAAHQHLAAAAYAAHALPFEVFLLAMLLEEHKQVLRLQTRLEHLYRSNDMGEQWDELFPSLGEPALFSAPPQLAEQDWDALLPGEAPGDLPPPDEHAAGQAGGATPGGATPGEIG